MSISDSLGVCKVEKIKNRKIQVLKKKNCSYNMNPTFPKADRSMTACHHGYSDMGSRPFNLQIFGSILVLMK
jgi:hypothetical protein